MIRILLADDETLVRDAVAGLLGLHDDLHVVATAASGAEAVAAALKHGPDVAVLDLQMPGLDGIQTAQQLSTALPGCRTIIVTSFGRPGYLKKALAAGVSAFLPKTVSAHVLADVIRQVHAGGRYVDPQLAAEAISTGESPLTPERPTSSSSPATAPASMTSPPKPTSAPAPSATTSPPRPPNSAPRTGTRQPRSPADTAGSDTTPRPRPGRPTAIEGAIR